MNTHLPWVALRLLGGAAILTLGGCADANAIPSEPEMLGQQTSAFVGPPVPDGCKTIAADATWWVPTGPINDEIEFHSDGAAYYYRSECGYALFDVKMAGYSNAGTQASPGPGYVEWRTGAHDIPGSKAFGDRLPVNAEDCKRLITEMKVYRKLATESAFTQIRYAKTTYAWIGNHCDGTVVTQSGSAPWNLDNISGTGWDTWRLAVRIKERTSGQEAGVWFPLPEPE